MLKYLQINNYALIQSLEMNPSQSLTTITGETGAGKSIMLGAVGLLLGNRADTKSLLNHEAKCVIEGVFDIRTYSIREFFNSQDLDYYDECILRREISPSGKSRAFVNDTPVTLDTMKELGTYLIDVHSQTDTLLLRKRDFQLQLVDAFAGNSDLLKAYQGIYKDYRSSKKIYESLVKNADDINKEADYNRFLFEELEKADLKANEQHQLEEELKLLEHAEEIKKRFFESIELLTQNEFATVPSLEQITRNITALRAYSENYKNLANRLESCLIELKDITSEIEKEEEGIELDQPKQEAINDRLNLIYKLQQKHHVESIEALLQIKEELSNKLERADNLEADIEDARKKVQELEQQLQKVGTQLSESRTSVFISLKDKIRELVSALGMPHADIEFKHETTDASLSGLDDIDLLFSANKGIKPEALKNVASGGEFSRLMFAIKHILAERTALPTIIFDEIDTGVSGEIALKLGALMKQMSTNHQVITITHLPQIAAHGETHYFVYKDDSSPKSVSKIKALNNEDRTIEIAKMIGGDNPSDTALTNAKELLARV